MFVTYLLLGLFLLFIAFVLLTGFGPKDSEKEYWILLQSARKIVDRICAFIILFGIGASIILTATLGTIQAYRGSDVQDLRDHVLFCLLFLYCAFSVIRTKYFLTGRSLSDYFLWFRKKK